MASVLQEAGKSGKGRKEEMIRALIKFMESLSLADYQAEQTFWNP